MKKINEIAFFYFCVTSQKFGSYLISKRVKVRYNVQYENMVHLRGLEARSPHGGTHKENGRNRTAYSY